MDVVLARLQQKMAKKAIRKGQMKKGEGTRVTSWTGTHVTIVGVLQCEGVVIAGDYHVLRTASLATPDASYFWDIIPETAQGDRCRFHNLSSSDQHVNRMLRVSHGLPFNPVGEAVRVAQFKAELQQHWSQLSAKVPPGKDPYLATKGSLEEPLCLRLDIPLINIYKDKRDHHSRIHYHSKSIEVPNIKKEKRVVLNSFPLHGKYWPQEPHKCAYRKACYYLAFLIQDTSSVYPQVSFKQYQDLLWQLQHSEEEEEQEDDEDAWDKLLTQAPPKPVEPVYEQISDDEEAEAKRKKIDDDNMFFVDTEGFQGEIEDGCTTTAAVVQSPIDVDVDVDNDKVTTDEEEKQAATGEAELDNRTEPQLDDQKKEEPLEDTTQDAEMDNQNTKAQMDYQKKETMGNNTREEEKALNQQGTTEPSSKPKRSKKRHTWRKAPMRRKAVTLTSEYPSQGTTQPLSSSDEKRVKNITTIWRKSLKPPLSPPRILCQKAPPPQINAKSKKPFGLLVVSNMLQNVEQSCDLSEFVIVGVIDEHNHPCKGSYGAFAARDIDAGTPIGWYSGVVGWGQEVGDQTYAMNFEWKLKNPSNAISTIPADVIPDADDSGEEALFIDAKGWASETAFINDAIGTGRENNLVMETSNVIYDRMQGHPVCRITTIRHIQKDEELLLSYGTSYWSARDVKFENEVQVSCKPMYTRLPDGQRVPDQWKYTPVPRWFPYPFESPADVCMPRVMPHLKYKENMNAEGDTTYYAVAAKKITKYCQLGYVGGIPIERSDSSPAGAATHKDDGPNMMGCRSTRCPDITHVLVLNEPIYFQDTQTEPNVMFRWISNDYGQPVLQVVTIEDIACQEPFKLNWDNTTLFVE